MTVNKKFWRKEVESDTICLKKGKNKLISKVNLKLPSSLCSSTILDPTSQAKSFVACVRMLVGFNFPNILTGNTKSFSSTWSDGIDLTSVCYLTVESEERTNN